MDWGRVRRKHAEGRRRCGEALLLEAEKRLHRITGYRRMPILIEVLRQGVERKEAFALRKLARSLPDRRADFNGKKNNLKLGTA